MGLILWSPHEIKYLVKWCGLYNIPGLVKDGWCKTRIDEGCNSRHWQFVVKEDVSTVHPLWMLCSHFLLSFSTFSQIPDEKFIFYNHVKEEFILWNTFLVPIHQIFVLATFLMRQTYCKIPNFDRYLFSLILQVV